MFFHSGGGKVVYDMHTPGVEKGTGNSREVTYGGFERPFSVC
jgi:hypothetical protein